MKISRILGERGRTTIPDSMRRKLGWQAGDTLRFWLHGDRVIITREHAAVREKPKPAREKPRPKLLMLLIGGDADD